MNWKTISDDGKGSFALGSVELALYKWPPNQNQLTESRQFPLKS